MKNTTLSIILLSMLSGFIGAQDISEWREENHNGILYMGHSNALMAYNIKAR